MEDSCKIIPGLTYPDKNGFNEITARLQIATGTSSYRDMFKALGFKAPSVHNAIKNQQVQAKWIVEAVVRYRASALWLIFGDDEYKKSGEIRLLPIIEPVLSSNNKIDLNRVVGHFPFILDWLTDKGNIDELVLIRAVGDSMEPLICDKDLVLLNISRSDPHPGAIFAVAFNGGLHLKRIHTTPGKIIMQTENKRYPEAEIDLVAGKLPKTVKIIGRVLCWWHEESL